MWRMQVSNLTVRFDGEALFEDLAFELQGGDRLALVGDNGSGKSTLIRVLASRLQPDEGTVTFTPHRPVVAYLPQEMQGCHPDDTLWEFARSGLGEVVDLERRLQEMEEAMAAGGGAAERVLAEYTALREEFESLQGYSWRSRLKGVLGRMDLPESWWGRRVSALSGGERTRLLFARLLASQPGLLLLDEPTNNLDWPTLEWLQDFFLDFRGTILYVSHDREFLERTATRVMELSRGELVVYDCDYLTYREERRLARDRRWAQYEKQEKERRRLMEVLRRQKEWANRAHSQAGTNDFLRRKAKLAARKARAVESRIEHRLQERAAKPWQKDGLNLQIDSGPRTKESIAWASRLSVGYDGEAVASAIDLDLKRNDRLAIVGANGTGKSTLLKTLQGALPPVDGEVCVSEGIEIFVLEQEVDDVDPSLAPAEWLADRTGADRTAVRTALACMGLGGRHGTARFDQLSRGQKVRAVLAQLILASPGLIFLDEPTNHLDLDSREQVEDALDQYPGALVFASHDLYFVRRLSSRVLDLDCRPPRFFRGSYDEYRARSTGDPDEDERLLLQTRASQLAGRLSEMREEAPAEQYEEWARQYRQIQAQLREWRSRDCDPGT
ncbi:MAG: ABC-F family ATP-binding cassette domain-containing protein [Bacillota bacterium]